ncbi:MAG: hypothetical protein K2Q04_09670 [Hyphomicrobium sp.]|nr:hypothetical protein [Hyphomicrobium sp.]
MTNRLFQRWFVVLGMVAMFGALISMPMTATYALAMSGQTSATSGDMSMLAAADEMPCHNPMKHCPHCPQKVCPEMGSCLVKCFQPMPQPIAEARLQRDSVGQRVMPSPTRVTASSLIPPLLRPPSV